MPFIHKPSFYKSSFLHPTSNNNFPILNAVTAAAIIRIFHAKYSLPPQNHRFVHLNFTLSLILKPLYYLLVKNKRNLKGLPLCKLHSFFEARNVIKSKSLDSLTKLSPYHETNKNSSKILSNLTSFRSDTHQSNGRIPLYLTLLKHFLLLLLPSLFLEKNKK